MLYIVFLICFFLAVIYCVICEFILKKRYSNATFLTTIALSFTASLGGYCIITSIFSNPRENPIEYPAGMIGAPICVAAFIALITLYIVKRSKIMYVSAIVIDAVFATLMIVPFFCCLSYVHEMLGNAIFTIF